MTTNRKNMKTTSNPMTLLKSSISDSELSAPVAEFVVGWGPHDFRAEPCSRGSVFICRNCNDTFCYIPEHGKAWCKEDAFAKPPPFATSADAVLPLLETMKSNGWYIEIKDHTNRINCGIRDWLVILTNYNPSGHLPFPKKTKIRYIEGVSPIFSKAICFALLRAAGVEVVE